MDWCKNQERCGGCFYQEIPYEEELDKKKEEIQQLFSPVIRGDYLFEGILSSPKKEAYRNKMEFSFGDQEKDGPLCLGLHQKRSFFNILNTEDCRLPDADMGKILLVTREFFSERGIPYFHWNGTSAPLRNEGEEKLLSDWCSALLKLEKEGEIRGRFAGILHTRNDSLADAVINQGTEILFGKDCFYEELLGLRFKITPFSFFQTNTLGAEKLYSKIREYADLSDSAAEKPLIFDLYSGTGTITQLMSRVARKAYGVEIIEEAVESAKENAKDNGITNCHFIAGDVLKVLEESAKREDAKEEKLQKEDQHGEENLETNVLPHPDFIIVDPPRDGMHKKALELIIRYGVKRLIYVACKPKSLARDLEALQNAGYRVKKLCAVDMFPRTNNVETVALLSKLDVDKHIDVEIKLDELDLTSAESKATYAEIQEYVWGKYELKVSTLCIAQVKKKCGIKLREHYNKSKKENQVIPQCTPKKEKIIVEALNHFKMI